MTLATGYSSQEYARSLAEIGAAMRLSRSGGWLLTRGVPETDWRDATGPYPFFCCRDWPSLASDLDDLDPRLLSVVLVTDPFSGFDASQLKEVFPDLVRPFKTHYVADFSESPASHASRHSKRYAKSSLRALSIGRCKDLEHHLDNWVQLYSQLIERHQIQGMARFSRESFRLQLKTPGIVGFRALEGNEVAGMTLWFRQQEIAYYHLGAFTSRGYELRASYGLMWEALHWFAEQGCRWASLGGAAGISEDQGDGLSRFKRGWANSTRQTFLCGRIIDRSAYRRAVSARGDLAESMDGFFPAYRGFP